MIYTIVIGFLIGLVARFLFPGKDPLGIIWTILLGIAGSVVGSYTGQILGFYAAGQAAGFIMSVIGAMLLLFLYRTVRARG